MENASNEYERRVKRARKLARKFGLVLTNRPYRSGAEAGFWMLGPPRSFEDIELELLTREERESAPPGPTAEDFRDRLLEHHRRMREIRDERETQADER